MEADWLRYIKPTIQEEHQCFFMHECIQGLVQEENCHLSKGSLIRSFMRQRKRSAAYHVAEKPHHVNSAILTTFPLVDSLLTVSKY